MSNTVAATRAQFSGIMTAKYYYFDHLEKISEIRT